jgi:LmbE family N-acetylglucosaminyl deacetylase
MPGDKGPIRSAEGLTALRERARRLLVVLPHPDDESYGCAGTLARLGADPDAATVFLCLTRGEASSMGPQRGMSRDEVAALRARRLEEVAAVVDLDGLLIADLPDGGMARRPLDELTAPIRAALESFRPGVVIGHDPRGVNAHPDHIASHWALRDALRDRKDVRFAMLAYPADLCEAVKPRLLFPTPEDEIDVAIHLTDEETEKKERCLRIHEALVTLLPDGEPGLLHRPPIERYDLFGEELEPPADDLFA